MKTTRNTHSLTIRSLVERSFISASLLILVIVSIAAIYFNQQSLQEKRDSNLQKIHSILTSFINPELSISNTSEIRRLLQLASTPDEFFVVVDSNGLALMPDYSQASALGSILKSKEMHNCSAITTTYREIHGNSYWITCSPLMQDDILYRSKQAGVLLTFSKYKWLLVSPIMAYYFVVGFFTLFLIIIWFRQILYRRLLQPTIILGSRIVQMAETPLTSCTSIGDIGGAPSEIMSIKHAFETVLTKLQSEYKHRTDSEKKAALLDLAAQVAHDIRSPLAVMEMTLAATSKYLPEEDATIHKQAIQSMRDIANNLLMRYRKSETSLTIPPTIKSTDNDAISHSVFIHPIIEQMLSHKRYEWQNPDCQINFNFHPETKPICISISPNELKAVISNLLNNAYESLATNKTINLKLEMIDGALNLHIIDTGIGIHPNMANAVLNGVSLKHGGKGLGLSGAKNIMAKIGGDLSLTSIPNTGTHVTLTFPNPFKPRWLPEAIKLSANGPLIILDDDHSIHSLWKKRLKLKMLPTFHFQSIHEVIDWCDKNQDLSLNATFLVDYELSSGSSNGLDLLIKLNANKRGYLITSHADENNIQVAVEKINAWLIPKSLIGDFPLESS